MFTRQDAGTICTDSVRDRMQILYCVPISSRQPIERQLDPRLGSQESSSPADVQGYLLVREKDLKATAGSCFQDSQSRLTGIFWAGHLDGGQVSRAMRPG
jgi:hypothetical protein